MPNGGRLTIETSNTSLDWAYAEENADGTAHHRFAAWNGPWPRVEREDAASGGRACRFVS
jgi:hypothetical protein